MGLLRMSTFALSIVRELLFLTLPQLLLWACATILTRLRNGAHPTYHAAERAVLFAAVPSHAASAKVLLHAARQRYELRRVAVLVNVVDIWRQQAGEFAAARVVGVQEAGHAVAIRKFSSVGGARGCGADFGEAAHPGNLRAWHLDGNRLARRNVYIARLRAEAVGAA